MNEFVDPYEQLDKADLNNTTIEVGRADQAYLYSLFPHRSVLQITVNILLSRFVRACKENGLKHYDPIRYRDFVERTTFTLKPPTDTGDGRTTPVNHGGTNKDQSSQITGGNDGGGVPKVGDVDKGLSAATSNLSSGVEGGKRTTKAKKTKGT